MYIWKCENPNKSITLQNNDKAMKTNTFSPLELEKRLIPRPSFRSNSFGKMQFNIDIQILYRNSLLGLQKSSFHVSDNLFQPLVPRCKEDVHNDLHNNVV